MTAAIEIKKKKKQTFLDKVKDILPDAGNLSLCLTCGACTNGCPATGLADMDPRKFLRMAVLGMDEELAEHDWVWMCTLCARCTHACPMNINIAGLVYEARKLWPREKRPKGIVGSCDMALKNESTSATGTPPDDFVFVVEDVLEDVHDLQYGWDDMEAPMDKEGAHFFVSQNSREPVTLPDEMVPLWKILHSVGADWTYGSTAWAGENYCMFLADDEAWAKVSAATIRKAESLGCKVYLNTECGHSTYSVLEGARRFGIETDLEIAPMVKYYAKWIREGKLKVNSDWNKEKKIKFTTQDPCNQIRKGYGNELAEDLRFVLKTVVGEENFVDVTPNMANNYCCGGGGGALQAGYADERRKYGKIKFDQIMATGAQYVAVPCHNCHAQIHDLSHYYKGGYYTVNLWTIICLAMGILGSNERVDLGPDLVDFMVPEEKED